MSNRGLKLPGSLSCISILARFIIMSNRGLKLPRWEVEQGVMRYALVPERDEVLLADEMWLFLWSKTVGKYSCINLHLTTDMMRGSVVETFGSRSPDSWFNLVCCVNCPLGGGGGSRINRISLI
ncbi:hypothetical protein ACS0TY_025145 [Phlomoides rotata]